MKFRTALLAAASTMTMMGLPSAAFAQASSEDVEAKDPGTIIVTARRREEALQDVPLAINAFTEEQIDRERIRRVEDLTRLTAGLTYDIGGFPNDTRPAMRGMQAERGRPSVAILLDGQDLSGENLAIAGGSAALEMNLFDLERVEVVKGPQVTLYGRNAFAGAINYISKAPSFNFGAKVSAETATGSLIGVSGSITGPIIKDILAFRLNGNYRDSDGYYQVPGTGDKVGAQNSKGIAASFLLTPATGLKITGRYQYSKDRASDNPTAFIKSNIRVPVPTAPLPRSPVGPHHHALPVWWVPALKSSTAARAALLSAKFRRMKAGSRWAVTH